MGITIRAENIGTAFQLATDYLDERYPRSEVTVQACSASVTNSEFTPTHVIRPRKLDAANYDAKGCPAARAQGETADLHGRSLMRGES